MDVINTSVFVSGGTRSNPLLHVYDLHANLFVPEYLGYCEGDIGTLWNMVFHQDRLYSVENIVGNGSNVIVALNVSNPLYPTNGIEIRTELARLNYIGKEYS